jgi:palmitoyltransferase
LLEFKNEVIWKLVTEKKLDEEQIKADLERQAAEEINEWSKLVDRFSNELRKFQQVCYYCGCPMEKDNVNGTCAYNTPE